MATVYEAVHTVLPRRAALKVLHGHLLRHPGMATRMVQEAAILEGVRHPGVVRVYECNLLPDHRPWIAMELIEGETLANRLHYATTLPALDVATLVADIADVLASVHQADVIHRDLKPDNILCTPTNGDYALRVLDWGVARLGPMGRLTLDGLTPGTPMYMSPEQATGLNVGPPCDIYSLGVIAYEALTGEPPFDGRTLAEVVYMHLTRAPAPLRERCNAPAELCDLVTRMLEKDPAMRPGTIEVRQVCRAIAMALAPYEAFEITGAEPDSHLGATRCRTAPDELEYGVTEMLPVMPKPRWTPDFDHVPAALAARRNRVIGPRSPRDQVAGEINMFDKPR
jgi:serine/threonine-protein kinase